MVSESPHCPPGPGASPVLDAPYLFPIGNYKKAQRNTRERLPVFLDQCTPMKTGSTQFTRLLGWAVDGRLGHLGRGVLQDTQCRAPLIRTGEAANGRTLSFLVTRNPYERLLSGFLGQVAARNCSSEHSLSDMRACIHDQKIRQAELELDFAPEASLNQDQKQPPRLSAFAATPEGFADFVPKLIKAWHAPRRPIGNVFAFNHLAPITGHDVNLKRTSGKDQRMGCLMRNHTRGLRLSEYYSVLKLEHQSEWYPIWVEATGLSEWVNSSRWAGGCFWRARGRSCAESLQVGAGEVAGGSGAAGTGGGNRGDGGVGGGSRGAGGGSDGGGDGGSDGGADGGDDGAHECTVAGGHNLGACSKLRRFYTRALADTVSALFAGDLQEFAYPRWNPEEEPAPSAGPNIARWDRAGGMVNHARDCVCTAPAG
jgi:hypothetical protein